MKIKILALLAALALTVSMFAACGGGTSSSGGSSGSTEGSSGSEEKPKDAAELIWYQFGDPKTDQDVVYKKLNELSKEKLNTTVDFRFASNEKATLIVSTNEYYDIIFSCSWQNNFPDQAAKGMFADLTEVLPKSAPELYEYIPQNCWDSMKINDKIYGVPTYKDSAATFLWNMPQSVIDKADLQGEWDALTQDINSCYPLVEKLQKYLNDNGPLPETNTTNALMFGTGGWFPCFDLDYISYNAGGFIVPYDSTDGKIMHRLQYEGSIDAIKFMKKCWDNGIINKDAPTNDAPAESVFGIGQGWPGCEPFWTSINYGEKVVKVKDPTMYTTAFVQGSAQAISLSSKYIDRAIEYLQYCNLDVEYRNILCYGIEGVHWEMQPEGNVKRTEKGLAGYKPDSFSQATFFTTYNEAPTPAGSWDSLKEAVDAAPATILNGFIWNSSEVETEMASLATTWKKYESKLNLGNLKDVDAEVAKILKEFQDIGLDAVLANAQEKADKYIAEHK